MGATEMWWGVIILIAVGLILYYKGFGKVKRAFYDQCSVYQDGVPIDRFYQTSQELYEDFLKGKQNACVGDRDKVIVYGQIERHIFYLENGKVKYEYPQDFFLSRGAVRTTQQMLLARKTKIIVEANEIMDNLRAVNGIDIKDKYYSAWSEVSSGQKMMWLSFVPIILAVAVMVILYLGDESQSNGLQSKESQSNELPSDSFDEEMLYTQAIYETNSLIEDAVGDLNDVHYSDYEDWRVEYVRTSLAKDDGFDCTGTHDVYDVYVDMEYDGITEKVTFMMWVPSNNPNDHFHAQIVDYSSY